MTPIIIFLFLSAISIFYLNELAKIDRFRKNLHCGDVVKYKSGQGIFIGTVQQIPDQNLIVIQDLTTLENHTVLINGIYPL